MTVKQLHLLSDLLNEYGVWSLTRGRLPDWSVTHDLMVAVSEDIAEAENKKPEWVTRGGGSK